jgi:hypothetical protein
VTHERERRTAHHRQQGRQRHLRAASLPQHRDHQHQDHDCQQNEEDEQGAVGPLELQVVPPSAHPLVPRGAQRDREILNGGTRTLRRTSVPAPCATATAWSSGSGVRPVYSQPARCRGRRRLLGLPAIADVLKTPNASEIDARFARVFALGYVRCSSPTRSCVMSSRPRAGRVCAAANPRTR